MFDSKGLKNLFSSGQIYFPEKCFLRKNITTVHIEYTNLASFQQFQLFLPSIVGHQG